MPPRTQLTAFDPVGLGTAWVESLASWLMRLAAAHDLATGVLILESVGPAIGRSRAYGPLDIDGHYFSAFLKDAPWSVNGRDQAARLFVAALEALTGRAGLARLTMLPWRRVLVSKGLLRHGQAYCPRCLARWQAAGAPVYYPLAWSIAAVAACAEHDAALAVRCPDEACGAVQVPLTFWSRPGYCTRVECGRWLGSAPPELDGRRPRRTVPAWDAWTAPQVGEILGLGAAAEEGSAPRVGAAIRSIVEECAAGNAAAFGRAVGAPRSLVGDWRRARVLPTLPFVLRIGAISGYSPGALLQGRLVRADEPYAGAIPGVREDHHPIGWDALRLALEGAAATRDGPPPTLTALLSEFRADRRVVERRYPGLCGQVVRAGERYRERVRREREAAQVTQVRQAIDVLTAAGLHAGKGRIQKLVGFQLRGGPALEAWHEAVTPADS